MTVKEITKIAEARWKECHGCDNNDKNFWMNGFITGYLMAENQNLVGQEVGHSVQVEETLEEAAELNCESITHPYCDREKAMFIEGAKWQQEKLLKFINDEDNHTEGELGNSCIDVQSFIYFMGQFKKQ